MKKAHKVYLAQNDPDIQIHAISEDKILFFRGFSHISLRLTSYTTFLHYRCGKISRIAAVINILIYFRSQPSGHLRLICNYIENTRSALTL